MNKVYELQKESKGGKVQDLDYNKLNGFTFTPQNKVEYPGIEVNSMLVVKNSFIEKLLKKKNQRKLDYYLQYIINIIENDESDEGDLREALNSLTRYKDVVNYKYRMYLDDKYINLLLKKIALIEVELKSKIIYKSFNYYANPANIHEEEKGKSR